MGPTSTGDAFRASLVAAATPFPHHVGAWPSSPGQNSRGWGGALCRRRAFMCVLAAAVVASALLCLFYGAAFSPILRRRHPFRLRLRASQAQAPVLARVRFLGHVGRVLPRHGGPGGRDYPDPPKAGMLLRDANVAVPEDKFLYRVPGERRGEEAIWCLTFRSSDIVATWASVAEDIRGRREVLG